MKQKRKEIQRKHTEKKFITLQQNDNTNDWKTFLC